MYNIVLLNHGILESSGTSHLFAGSPPDVLCDKASTIIFHYPNFFN